MRGDKILTSWSNMRLMGRVGAAEEFYGSSKGQINSAFVVNELEKDTGETPFRRWIDKVRRFGNICRNYVTRKFCDH